MNKLTWRKLMRMGARFGCHQRADRSFFFHGKQFPVCARCTGVLIGYALSAVTVLIFLPPLSWCAVLCWIMFADWLLQFLKLRQSTNIRRLITGILGGYGIMTVEIKILIIIVKYIKEVFI